MAVNRKPKLLIIGHGRHGKDTVAEMLGHQLGLSFMSSSEFAAKNAVFPITGDMYPDWQAAYADRANHRALWFHAISAYNLKPGQSLAAQLLETHDIYTGMRSRSEFSRAKHLFDFVVWVDASERQPLEPASSMELVRADAHITVDNNGTEARLRRTCRAAGEYIALHCTNGELT